MSLRRALLLGVFVWALWELVGDAAVVGAERAVGRATRS